MRHLFLGLVLLVGCSKEQVCMSLDPVASTVAVFAAAEYGCDIRQMKPDVMEMLGAVVQCDRTSKFAGLAVKSISCAIVPQLASIMNMYGVDKWSCKKGFVPMDMLNAALGCNKAPKK